MKVLLRKPVKKLGTVGDVVTVKPGYARNYLIPRHLAVMPTAANLKVVEVEKAKHLAELAKMRGQLEAKAALLRGKEITIAVNANEEGHLYGSVGPAQIVAALAAEGVFVEAEQVNLAQPIRQLDKYDVELELIETVTAMIHVWVVRAREEGAESPDSEPAPSEPGAGENE
ncbi:MAG: 50S ribosomal protein L9 [Planctomycetota bacterium]|nr:50S ribosomal protein L9 [Planctomycetota bacterium]